MYESRDVSGIEEKREAKISVQRAVGGHRDMRIASHHSNNCIIGMYVPFFS